MSNKDCENFRESMNSEYSTENPPETDRKENMRICAKNMFGVMPKLTDDRDPIGDDR